MTPTTSRDADATSPGPHETSWFARLRRLRALAKDPARIGDAAVLKSALLGEPMSDRARACVEELVARHGDRTLRPRVDFDALRRLPPGTFGRALVEFCDANHIIPAAVSDEFDDHELRRKAAVARYIAVHDMFHVLLGCDTSIPGELRITAFILQQGYFRASRFFLALLHVVGPLVRPHQALRIFDNLRTGRALARSAPMLLGEPLENFFAEDLAHLQRRLGLATA